MKTILISTSSLWNCGDDFIRKGLLDLMGLRPLIRTVWWNRAYGVTPTFANDIHVNLRATDYILIAGTPEWLDRNEELYRYALRHGLPISLVGVGLRGCMKSASQRKLLQDVAQSGLVEVCLVRDRVALNFLRECGFKNADLMLDPAFFMKPLSNTKTHHALCWRNIAQPRPALFRRPLPFAYWMWRGRGRSERRSSMYNRFMQAVFAAMAEPKIVIVHDNREIRPAERLFGTDRVFYSTDCQELLKVYSSAMSYVGSRIHGAVAAAIHGSCCHLIYANIKACVLQDSVSLLSRYMDGVDEGIKVSFLEDEGLDISDVGGVPFDRVAFSMALRKEETRIRKRLLDAPELREYIEQHGAAPDGAQLH